MKLRRLQNDVLKGIFTLREHSFYNVGHGDAILIESDDYIAVRDLGQYSQKNQIYNKNFNMALKRLLATEKRKYAIISHGHTDHVTGFVDLYKQNKVNLFESSFIPPLVMNVNGQSIYASLYNKVYFLLFLYSSLRNGRVTKKNISNWLILLPVMCYLSRNVRLVRCGDSILQNEATVLWPNYNLYTSSAWLNLENLFDDESSIDFAKNSEYRQSLKRLFDSREAVSIHKFANKIVEIYKNLLDETGLRSKEVNSDECQIYVEEILDILKRIKSLPKTWLSKNVKRVLCTALKKDDDNQSVVFQFNDASAIYLSDLYCIDELVDSMVINQQNLKSYKLLKSSHHGSRFAQKIQRLPYSTVVHCCGVGAKNHNGPDLGYTLAHNGAVVVCLDWDARTARKKPWNQNVLNHSTLIHPGSDYSVNV